MKLLLLTFLFGQFFAYAIAGLFRDKLTALEKLDITSLNQKKVTEMFGKPSRVVEAKSLHGASAELGSVWEYDEGDGARLSVSVGQGAQTILGWNWAVLTGDFEQDLKKALNEFPGASWNADTEKWVNPHQFPMECFYTDNKLGIKISYSRVRKEVTAISRWNPSRKPSSTDDEKPPRFCIENACADAKLSRDVFKDDPICKLPK